MKYNTFNIVLSKKSLKQLEKIPKKERTAIVEKIELLTTYIDSLDIKKLQGYENLYRLRCGNYRIVFCPELPLKVLKVLLVAHRKEVYEMLDSLKFVA